MDGVDRGDQLRIMRNEFAYVAHSKIGTKSLSGNIRLQFIAGILRLELIGGPAKGEKKG